MARKIDIKKQKAPMAIGYTSGRKIEFGDGKAKKSKKAKVTTVPKATNVEKEPEAIGSNGHAKAIKRKLTDTEKNFIKLHFLKIGGIIQEDSCKAIRDKMDDDVTIFQVVGTVRALHSKVANGELTVKDKKAYNAAIKSHRKTWLTYRGAKYDAMRDEAGVEPLEA